jgi:putative endonuclease
MLGHVYIIRSLKNGRYYVGSTNDLERRLVEHNAGKTKYTSKSMPWVMVFNQKFRTLSIARKAECWVKRQKDREFIERLINERKLEKGFG